MKNQAFTDNTIKHVQTAYGESALSTPDWVQGTGNIALAKLIINKKISKSKVLDIGCGYGQNAIMLATNHFDVTGIDIMPEAINRAKLLANLYGLDINFVEGDVLELPFEDETFDIVNDTFVFHNIKPENRDLFAKNIYNVLKNNGLYIMVEFSDRMSSGSGPIRLTSKDIIHTFDKYLSCEHLEYIENFPTIKRPDQIHWFSIWRKKNL